MNIPAGFDPKVAKYANVSNDALIVSWREVAANLAALKDTEMELRKAVTQRMFPDPDKGTQRYDLGNGWQLKLVHKLNYKLPGKTENDKIDAVSDQIEKIGNEGAFILDRLVKWSAELSVSEYNKLKDDAKAGSGTARSIEKLIDTILTISPAAPTLELEPPKTK